MDHEDGPKVQFGSADLETRPSTADQVSGAPGHIRKIWTGPVQGRHGSLALALAGTRPSFWSGHQAERGSDVLLRRPPQTSSSFFGLVTRSAPEILFSLRPWAGGGARG